MAISFGERQQLQIWSITMLKIQYCKNFNDMSVSNQ